ncbi:MAG: ankyrin repeat domain-containing protein, partial [Bacteroidetes bacterium]|nr:ankyrin repeat domain-containing protein [Bacteroidota bacterium]
MNTTSILPFPSYSLMEQFDQQAKRLTDAGRKGEEALLHRIRQDFPVFLQLRERRNLRPDTFGQADARFVVARSYGFESWAKLTEFTARLNRQHSEVMQFESAANAIITGDIATLGALLRCNPELIHLRSMRVHQATLLHYISANGVENYRQRTPENIVPIAQLLLDAGAEVDAPHPGIAGGGTALGLVATSGHPHRAGVQIDLMKLLLSAGAAVDGIPTGWQPLMAALANARPEAAALLAEHGACMTVVAAAGLGRMDWLMRFFDKKEKFSPPKPYVPIWHVPEDPQAQLVRALNYAGIYGHVDIAAFLVARDVPVGAQDEDGYTALHWAAHGGHIELLRWLLQQKAPLELKNCYGGTVLGQTLWSVCNNAEGWGGNKPGFDYREIIALLLEAGARIEPGTATWIRQQPSLSPVTRDRLLALFRQY